LILTGARFLITLLAAVPLTAGDFDRDVKPVLSSTCLPCHNEKNSTGGLNIGGFLDLKSVASEREGWERVLAKIRSGEMPPRGVPRPSAEKWKALRDTVEAEFDRIDRTTRTDPGRVTARRLNRNEYTNTIRDLLAVDFRADRNFPSDDSGHGFDNVADILTVSPVLMEKYVLAAERIAARAIGADPLPKPLESEYHAKTKTIRRPDKSTIEATHRVEWDGDYTVRIGLPGQRADDAPPVTMGFWMDGKLLHTMQVETKPSKLVYFNPYSEEEFRVYLPEGDHVFRAGFIGDKFVEPLDQKEAYNDKKNKFLSMITFVGPFPSTVEKPSRRKILICDPDTGRACVNRIVSTLAARAYRRPVTAKEVNDLLAFVELARREGASVERGIQLAIQAMLVSPHFLYRVERDPDPRDPSAIHKVTGYELASRLSYFLWSSMPDDELIRLAGQGTLGRPETLRAQVKRMLDDPRSESFASNFAGQWLETRNLDSVKPDPQKFPEWGPELREAMKQETALFFNSMLRENRPLGDFLDARFTFLNDTLARHYGFDGVTGPEFRRVELATEQRGGVLSHASVLTVTSYPTRTSPVIRGKYLLQNILGVPPPVPPPDVPQLEEESVGNKGSLRQQLEKHRTNPTCASCHSRMDVLGFGLENYDATGKWRTMDGKFPIDVSGTFPNGKSFATPAEMRTMLRDDLPEFARCITEKMLVYALGRGLELYDRKTVNAITRTLAGSGYKFQTLIEAVVLSPPFLERRGEAVSRNDSSKPSEVARQ
jgi:hypothetical protein